MVPSRRSKSRRRSLSRRSKSRRRSPRRSRQLRCEKVYRSSDDQTPETTGQTPEIAALAAAPSSAALAAAPPSAALAAAPSPAALAAERLAELTLTYKITASPFGEVPTQSPMLSANIKHTCYWFAVLHMFEFGKRTRLLRVMKEKVVDVLNAYFKKLSPDEKKKVRGDDWNDGEAYKVIEAVLEVAAIPGMRYNDMQRREISQISSFQVVLHRLTWMCSLT
jgi:hypothetical protein